ncbi:MAG: hypothetical protein KJ609_16805 [Gammaproteobacteria bacterium]|nr:hypothetical protein [Gammaproteobacteria bacterium]MBU1464724.1 hypothetical protein [Gammaproteobacteria bacterium]MBU2022068.1 hypothetical protein [Gammaproteobacteria bacterium]MBU2239746.1 hypothetical protein [Gammaproteobacteria bacterium]MBU2320214.1 hypothetical protein [Gammaproteobacteria bacterium]
MRHIGVSVLVIALTWCEWAIDTSGGVGRDPYLIASDQKTNILLKV